MGVLRQKMVDSMKVRGYARKTIHSYTSCVKKCSLFFMKSPLMLSKNEIERFLLFLREERRSDATIHLYYAALNYFYGMMQMRDDKMPHMSFSRKSHLLPEILSKGEIFQLISHCSSLKYRTLFALMYSSGLRISEVAKLRLKDIDYDRKGIFVQEGKNKKSRYTLLADGIIPVLRAYHTVFVPTDYLFYGKDPTICISTDAIQRQFHQAAFNAGIRKKVHVHTLRHCFATHLLESGTNIFFIMRLLGHSRIQTTMRYLHMESVVNMHISSPIDSLDPLCVIGSNPIQRDLFAVSASP